MTPRSPTLNASTSNASTLNASTLNASTPNASTPNASTSNASTSRKEYEIRAWWCAVVLAATTLVMVVVVNLPYRYSITQRQWTGDLSASSVPLSLDTDEIIDRAGWPQNFFLRHRAVLPRVSALDPTGRRPGKVLLLRWSATALIVDVFLGAGFVIAVWFATRARFRRISQSAQPARTRRRFEVALALFCGLVPAAALVHWSIEAARHRGVANRLIRGGNCLMSLQVPTLLEDRIPVWFHPLGMRVREITVGPQTQSVVGDVLDLSTVRTIRCFRMTPDPTWLSRLPDAPELTGLMMERCDLSEDAHAHIANCQSLRAISLFGSTIPTTAMAFYDQLERLETVDLRRTGLSLTQLRRPQWRHSVQHLWLPRPPIGQPTTLRLDQWNDLKEIWIQDEFLNDSLGTLHLHLTDLPSLHTLNLDRLQKHRLTAQRVPKLQSIRDPIDQLLMELGTDDELHGQTWFESIELDHLDTLQSLQCSALDLDSVRLANLPRLQSLTLGSFVFTRGGVTLLKPCDQSRVPDWITEIANAKSIQSLDLSCLPLQGIDLSPLRQLPYLKSLTLNYTGMTSAEFDWLPETHSLEQIVVTDGALTTELTARLLHELPRLKHLRADLSAVETLHLSDNETLSVLESREFSSLRKVSIEKMTRLSGRLRLGGPIESLRIVDLPRLDELTVTSPWPESAVIGELPNLQRFAGGGPRLDDAVVDELLRCPQLDELTLAYGDLSRPTLVRLGEMTNLTSLAVPGCGADDSIVAQWRGMTRLRSLCVDDSRIGAPTLFWLRSIPTLRRLSLARVDLDHQAWTALSQLRQLSEVCLAGTRPQAPELRRLLSDATIEILNLSGTSMEDEIWQVLSQSRGLKRLIIQDTDVSVDALTALLRTQTGLIVDVGDREAELSAAIPPHLANRLQPVRETEGYGFIPAYPDYGNVVARREVGGDFLTISFDRGEPALKLRSFLGVEKP